VSIAFCKYHGAGNDFILIDNRAGLFPIDDPELIRHLCHRPAGIGADGVLLIEHAENADYKMRIFNADGSSAAMCGNGIRCIFHFLTKDTVIKSLTIESEGRVLSCSWAGDQIRVDMGAPVVVHWPFLWNTVSIYVVDTGVPHAVFFVEDLMNISLQEKGREIRFDPAFAPSGVNVNAACIASDGSILLRTYERGLEAETLACGTGAAAVSFVATEVYGLKGPIAIKTRMSLATDQFQHSMQFSFNEKRIEMIGSAHCVFIGEIKSRDRF
jgi:diaminopimelate epimerase